MKKYIFLFLIGLLIVSPLLVWATETLVDQGAPGPKAWPVSQVNGGGGGGSAPTVFPTLYIVIPNASPTPTPNATPSSQNAIPAWVQNQFTPIPQFTQLPIATVNATEVNGANANVAVATVVPTIANGSAAEVAIATVMPNILTDLTNIFTSISGESVTVITTLAAFNNTSWPLITFSQQRNLTQVAVIIGSATTYPWTSSSTPIVPLLATDPTGTAYNGGSFTGASVQAWGYGGGNGSNIWYTSNPFNKAGSSSVVTSKYFQVQLSSATPLATYTPSAIPCTVIGWGK